MRSRRSTIMSKWKLSNASAWFWKALACKQSKIVYNFSFSDGSALVKPLQLEEYQGYLWILARGPEGNRLSMLDLWVILVAPTVKSTAIMSNETLLKKFDALDPHSQDQLIAFWDFLLARSGNQTTAIMSPVYRERIEQIGVWTEDDLAPIEEAGKHWQWEPPQW